MGGLLLTDLAMAYSLILNLQIRSIFVVLSDDMFRQILRQFDKKKAKAASAQPAQPPQPTRQVSATSTSSDDEGSEVSMADAAPVIPAPVPAPAVVDPRSRSRSHKRGASSALSGPNPKK